MEVWKKIAPAFQILEPFIGIEITYGRDGLILKCSGKNNNSFRVFFELKNLASFQYFEEAFDGILGRNQFAKTPWPMNENQNGTYPFLEVQDSEWLKSTRGAAEDSGFQNCKHYKFVSYDEIIDVLANSHPRIEKSAD